ncbi:MAG: hypothetical protein HOM01_00950 [Kordiimonadaceae bacterium]|nr:hypothetical protein [Kordiimonadaceae bacterium]
MKIGVLKAIINIVFASLVCCLSIVAAYAQDETQEQLFQNFQAMVIIEEFNQHCPLLSRLEAEALNGQIVMANSSFSGKLDEVEKFKKEARIFARRAACNTPEILNLAQPARQQANDAMINHLLLSRQIHLYDELDVEEGKIPGELLLNFLQDQEWEKIDNFYQEVKENYLSQASEEDWDKYLTSVETVAEDNKAEKYLSNERLRQPGSPDGFEKIQATARNREITEYYFNLEKTVLAFIEGADENRADYPYSRPSNDFTKWTSYRAREKALNWLLSYEGCGGTWGGIECTIFINDIGEIGVVLSNDDNVEIKDVVIAFRQPDDQDIYASFKTVEGPIGSNQANMDHMTGNAEVMSSSSNKEIFEASLNTDKNQFQSQTGIKAKEGKLVYIFSKDALSKMENLLKNDVVKLSINIVKDKENKQYDGLIPIHNYHRAKNWAYAE